MQRLLRLPAKESSILKPPRVYEWKGKAEARELEEIGEEQNNLTIARTKLPEVQVKSFDGGIHGVGKNHS